MLADSRELDSICRLQAHAPTIEIAEKFNQIIYAIQKFKISSLPPNEMAIVVGDCRKKGLTVRVLGPGGEQAPMLCPRCLKWVCLSARRFEMRWGLVYWGRLEGRQGLEWESGLGGMELEGVNEE